MFLSHCKFIFPFLICLPWLFLIFVSRNKFKNGPLLILGTWMLSWMFSRRNWEISSWKFSMKKYVIVTTSMGESGTHLCSLGLYIPRHYIGTDLSVSCRNSHDLHKDTADTSLSPKQSQKSSQASWEAHELTTRTWRSTRNASGCSKPMTQNSLVQC